MMFRSEDAERIRRSIALLAPGHPSALDREAAMALLAELQRLQGKDRRIQQLLDEVLHLLETARSVGNS
jgi:hypothetical protein